MAYSPSDLDIQRLGDKKDWIEEVNELAALIVKIEALGKNCSIRSLSQVTKKSKSWVAVSLIILKGLKTYPEIEKFNTRNSAFVYLQKKNKIRRTLRT